MGKAGHTAPSNRINIGVLACGSRSGVAADYQSYDKSQIVAVCDPIYERRVVRAFEWGVQDHYSDFREVLAREDVDAVHISTADHWHVPMSLAAARAGKDIYCEKPLGISIEQDLAAREIVSKHKRVFQYGTQQRSSQVCRMGIELILNGHIGEIQDIVVWCPGGFQGGSPTPVLPVPQGFDYDLWLGPAPEAPFSYDRCLNPEYNSKAIWYVYDYAIGFLGGWGAHPLDQLQWWADHEERGIPLTYQGRGQIPPQGLFNTVFRWDMECTYPDGLTVRFLDTESAHARVAELPAKITTDQLSGQGTLFVGSEGWVSVSRTVFHTSSGELRRKARNPGPIRLPVSSNHGHNFVDACLARKQPLSTLDSAISSDLISHMCDLSIRTGETLKWDPIRQTVIGSAEAVSRMHRPMRQPWTL